MEQSKKRINTIPKVFFGLLKYLLNLAFNLLTLGLSLLGVFCISYGLRIAFTDTVGLGLFLCAIGGCLFLLSTSVTKVRRFWRWMRYIRKKGLEEVICSDIHAAIQAYNAFPCLLTRMYIGRRNPSAGDYIRQNSTRKK